jgi:uncharacterized membrane protein HdeD (DUF308 family)
VIASPLDPREHLELLAKSWRLAFVAGFITMLAGIVVTLEPGTSLIVIAILVGAEFIASGMYRIIRSFTDNGSHGRVLFGILGVLSILVGAILIRHFDLTLLLVSTVVGVIWIALGVSEITIGFSSSDPSARRWLAGIGILGVIAGVVILAYPVSSLLTLALLLGIWLIIRGVAEMSAALATRRAQKST